MNGFSNYLRIGGLISYELEM